MRLGLDQPAHTLNTWARAIVVLLAMMVSFTPTASGYNASYRTVTAEAELPTGFAIASEFAPFYDAHGGLPLFGYAMGPPHKEGKYLVQWTERQRLEWHPENQGTSYEVLLGLLGRELMQGFDGPNFARSSAGTNGPPGSIYFRETGLRVNEPFATYWQENGGLPVFGYPISTRYTDDRGLQVQWFERARFEHHPELPAPYQVLLGHLGLESQRRREIPRYTLEVGSTPAPDTTLRVDLAQGGESDDPNFFDNVRSAGSELGPGLVRLDNIFNFYHIVQRDKQGSIYYQWTQLDRVLDAVVAMNKTPMISLSYMPETISADGKSRILPPFDYAEWAKLVSATVKHINGERRMGVRYWEVWNEPNEWAFWQGSYPDYLHLYDVTVEAALASDPSISIGGPALSRFSAGHLHEFFQHEVDRGALGHIGFVSWHSYGQEPSEIATDIRQVREIASHYPQFNPQLFITEFNVLQGSGDTSADARTDKVEGAISLLKAIESMQRERLDRAFLFELKDGLGPSRFWGRWGILTNDAAPKPIYHALRAYRNRPKGSLPVRLAVGDTSAFLGLMAYGGADKSTLLLWSTSVKPAHVKVALPPAFSSLEFDPLLFNDSTNNLAQSGTSDLKMSHPRSAGDLVFDLMPQSLLILTSR